MKKVLFVLVLIMAVMVVNAQVATTVDSTRTVVKVADLQKAITDNIAKDYVGQVWNREKLEKMMQLPLQKAKELGLQVYCGEYGTIEDTQEADGLRWFHDMISIFNKNHIASANWSYKGGLFGMIKDNGTKRKALIKEITRR